MELRNICDIANAISLEIEERFALKCVVVPCMHHTLGSVQNNTSQDKLYNSFSVIADDFSINVSENELSISFKTEVPKKYEMVIDSIDLAVSLEIGDKSIKRSFELSDPKSIDLLFEFLDRRLVEKQQK